MRSLAIFLITVPLMSISAQPMLRPISTTRENCIQTEARYINAKVLTSEQLRAAAKKDSPEEIVKRFKISKLNELEGKQKLDSIVTNNLKGDVTQVLTFEYDEFGAPFISKQYSIDPSSAKKILMAESGYEYDESGRVTCRYVIDINNPEECAKFEYGYSTENDVYDSEILYRYVNGAWVPFQMGEYAFGIDNYPILQVFYNYDSKSNEWLPFEKVETPYDEDGRQIGYYPYYFSNNTWIGYTDYSFPAQSYDYTPWGDDTNVSSYVWSDGAWLKFKQQVYTYNDNNKLTKYETIFWNPNTESWTGNYKWGQNLQTNSLQEYFYDEEGFLTLTTVSDYDSNLGEYVLFFRQETPVEKDEEGNTILGFVTYYLSNGEFLPTKAHEQIINPAGYEIYWKSYSYRTIDQVWTKLAVDEDIKDIDDYGNYFGGEFYVFTQDKANLRYASSKEIFEFPDGWEPTMGNYPSSGMIWIGHGASAGESWFEHLKYDYTWEEGELTNFTEYEFVKDDWIASSESIIDIDFSVENSDLIRWPLANKTDVYFNNKILSSSQLYNPSAYAGVTGWSDLYSIIDNYYWSDFSESAVEAIEEEGIQRTEIARYTINGIKIYKPVKGINIIEYSDGTHKKVFVK